MRSMLLVPVLTALLPLAANAQRLPAPFVRLGDQTSQTRQAVPATGHLENPAGAVAGAALGGIVVGFGGLLGGAALGARMEGPCYCDDPGLMGAIYGGLAGETVGMALGAHLFDGLRGNFGLDLLASAGGAALGLVIASGTDSGSLLIPAAALQMALVAAVEVGNARSKSMDP